MARFLSAYVMVAVFTCFFSCSSSVSNEGLLRDASEALENENYQLAAELLQSIKNPTKSKKPLVWEMLGDAYVGMGKIQKARQAYETRLKLESVNSDDTAVKLARLDVLAGEMADARKRVSSVIQRTPDRIDALLIQVALYEHDGAIQKAVALLERILSIDPSRGNIWMHLCRHYIRLNQIERALEAADSAVAVSTSDSSVWLLRFSLLVRLGALQKAEIQMSEMLEKFPDQFELQLIAGDFYSTQLNNPELAEKAYLASVQLGNGAVRPVLETGAFYRMIGKPGAAMRIYEDALTAQPHEPSIQSALADLLSEDHQAEAALSLLDDTLKGRPAFFPALLVKGKIYLTIGEYEKATKVLTRLVALKPDSGEAYYFLGASYMGLGNMPAAAACLSRSTALSPELAEAHVLVNGVRYRLQDFKAIFSQMNDGKQGELERQLDKALGQYSGVPVIRSALYQVKGNLLAAKGELFEAELYYFKAIKDNPVFMKPYYALVALAMGDNDAGRSVSRWRSQIAEPSDAAAIELLEGMLADAQGHPLTAEAHYLKAIEHDTVFNSAANLLAYRYAEQNRNIEEGIRLARKVLQQTGDAAVKDTLGYLLIRKGEYAAAVILFDEALESVPEHPEILQHKALALDGLGDSAGAEEIRNRAKYLQLRGTGQANDFFSSEPGAS